MNTRVLVSIDNYETRAAILENSVLTEYLFERNEHRRMNGNIYKARVCSIIPGMQASFVDIGLGRNAFLFVTDVVAPTWSGYRDMLELDGETTELDEEEIDETWHHDVPLPDLSIEDLMKEGQEILVQMEKEPIGDKGARVTANISLPGRFVVLLPNSRHVGVSRKISSLEEKQRLRDIGKQILHEEYGLILRTAAEGISAELLQADMEGLVRQWERIKRSSDESRAPALLYHEMGLAQRILRDCLNHDSAEFIVDSPGLYEQLRDYAHVLRPDLDCLVTLYEGRAPLLRAHGIESEVEKLLERKVWLDCGGHIVIDEAEALTVIDVNTGKYTGDRDLEETVLRANLEAGQEIARQLRLRNIGGIIVIDFIDMKQKENWDTLIAHLESFLQKDRAFTRVLGVTDLGLVEMTRKRVHKSLGRSLCQACPYCRRDGMVLSAQTMAIKALRRLEAITDEQPGKSVTLYVHPAVAGQVHQEFGSSLEAIRAKTGKDVDVVGHEQIHFEEIRLKPVAASSEAVLNLSL